MRSALQGSADEVTDAMARIFVWLRYSSSRQLTWQRNYNTQPRILGEAQARLTNAIAQVRCSMFTCMYVLVCVDLLSNALARSTK